MSHRLSTPKGEFIIRPAVVEDAAALRELRLEALANHPEAFAADYTATAAGSTETWVERITEYARENQGVICVAATFHGEAGSDPGESRLVGMLGLFREHWPKTRHSGTIWGVYVKEEWRGFRLAEALIDECIAWAQAQGLRIVKLGVNTANTPAIRCYARCGFTVYGIDPQVIFYNGVFYDELLMAKPIGSPSLEVG